MKKLCMCLMLTIGLFQLSAEKLQEIRSLDKFDKLSATNGINVILRKSAENEKVEVRIENGLLSDVITEVSKGELKVKVKAQINKELSVVVIVYYKQLNDISATKGAEIETKNVLFSERLELYTSTGGIIKAEIECGDVKAQAVSAGGMTLYGWAHRLDAKSTTGAELMLKKLKADTVIAKATTGGIIWVYPIDYLEAIANTSGKINYIHKPTKITEKISSGGEVIKEYDRNGGELKEKM